MAAYAQGALENVVPAIASAAAGGTVLNLVGTDALTSGTIALGSIDNVVGSTVGGYIDSALQPAARVLNLVTGSLPFYRIGWGASLANPTSPYSLMLLLGGATEMVHTVTGKMTGSILASATGTRYDSFSSEALSWLLTFALVRVLISPQIQSGANSAAVMAAGAAMAYVRSSYAVERDED